MNQSKQHFHSASIQTAKNFWATEGQIGTFRKIMFEFQSSSDMLVSVFWFRNLELLNSDTLNLYCQMAASPLQLAKRALVTLLLALAKSYGVRLGINRDSTDKVVLDSFRKVVRKVHPDKGGSNADVQKLNAARELWENLQKPNFFESFKIYRWGPGWRWRCFGHCSFEGRFQNFEHSRSSDLFWDQGLGAMAGLPELCSCFSGCLGRLALERHP